MRPKRRREGGRGGGSPPAPVLKKRCRSFDLEIRGRRHQQEFTSSCVEKIQTAISRIPEEVTKALTSFFNSVPVPRIEQDLPPTYKLSFLNSLSDEIFTKREVRAAAGGLIKIRLAVSNQQGSDSPRLLSARAKIVVLDGDFNADNHEGWTSEEFSNNIVRPRDKVGVVLTGDLELKLKNGEAYLENATFVDNSRFTRSGKFRLGVRLIDDLGVRVQEGITEPFIVKDRRGEGYKKCDIPRLDDEVFRLQKIAKNGVYHKALERSGIPTVKHFLRLLHKDANALRNILSKASESVWTTIVDHAKKCDPGRSLHSHFMEEKKIRLYFSSLGQIVGATIAGQYNAFSDLDTPWKAQVEEWSKDAYECMSYDQPDYEMYNSQPRPINCSNLQCSIMPGPKSTEPTAQIVHESEEQDTSKDNGFSSTHSGQILTLPSVHENNETDASFDIDVQLSSGPEIQYETPDANYNAASVTHCPPTNATGEIIALDQAALTMNQEDYQMLFTNDDYLLGHWYTEQQVASQYPSPFSLSMQADPPVLSSQNSFSMDQLFKNLPGDGNSQFCAPIVSELPAAVLGGMTKLPSYRRWLKLSAAVKLKAMLRASKRARLMLEQED